MAKRKRRKLILGTVDDLVTNFLYYGRKEDEELGCGEIEEAIKQGEVSIDEIVAAFRKHLEDGLGLK